MNFVCQAAWRAFSFSICSEICASSSSCAASHARQSACCFSTSAWLLIRSAFSFLMDLVIAVQRFCSRRDFSSLSSAIAVRRFDRIARDCEACVSTIFLCGAARPGVTALKSIGQAPKYGVFGLRQRTRVSRVEHRAQRYQRGNSSSRSLGRFHVNRSKKCGA